jgi:hypothetical protein
MGWGNVNLIVLDGARHITNFLLGGRCKEGGRGEKILRVGALEPDALSLRPSELQ